MQASGIFRVDLRHGSELASFGVRSKDSNKACAQSRLIRAVCFCRQCAYGWLLLLTSSPSSSLSFHATRCQCVVRSLGVLLLLSAHARRSST